MYGVSQEQNVFVIIIIIPFRNFQKEKLGIFYTYW